MKRILVLGASGAGKSVFSDELARRIGGVHIERDRLWGDRVPMESEEFRRAVEVATAGSTWIFDGMPYYVENLVFSRADTVVCLDYSKKAVMSRVVRRSLRQSLLRQHVGVHLATPFKDWRKADHPVRWSWSTHSERRSQMSEWSKRPETSHATWIFLSTSNEASRWLESL